MIKSDTLIALRDGYDVILEGILSVRSYGELLDEIFTGHPEKNYMFYFDVSLEETLRRHTGRETKLREFGETEMREWYPAAHRSNHRLEQLIPESLSLEETVRFIQQASGI